MSRTPVVTDRQTDGWHAEMGDRGRAKWAENGGEPLWPHSREGDGSPSNTMWLRPRHTSVPSGKLIHSRSTTIHQRYRQTGQLDSGLIAYGEKRFDRGGTSLYNGPIGQMALLPCIGHNYNTAMDVNVVGGPQGVRWRER